MQFNTLIALLLVYVVMRARFESPVFPATIRYIATGARHRLRAAVFHLLTLLALPLICCWTTRAWFCAA